MNALSPYVGLLLTGALAFTIIGAGIGAMLAVVYQDQVKLKHKAQMDEIYEEVKRLRAQNAMLIGKE